MDEKADAYNITLSLSAALPSYPRSAKIWRVFPSKRSAFARHLKASRDVSNDVESRPCFDKVSIPFKDAHVSARVVFPELDNQPLW
jgi:hypothetical protein